MRYNHTRNILSLWILLCLHCLCKNSSLYPSIHSIYQYLWILGVGSVCTGNSELKFQCKIYVCGIILAHKTCDWYCVRRMGLIHVINNADTMYMYVCVYILQASTNGYFSMGKVLTSKPFPGKLPWSQ